MSGLVFAVVMVGHSLFGQDGPDMLGAALRAGDHGAEVSAQIINGAPLKYNWDRSAEAEGIDARAVLPQGGTSHLILTEAIPLADQVQWNDSDQYAMAFAGLALDANPQAQVYLQETWHSLDVGTGAEAAALAGTDVDIENGAAATWRLRLDQDFGVWNGIAEAMRRARPEDAARIHLIPAGQAMGRLHDALAGGQVPGLPQGAGIEAFFADEIHPNDLGHYFVAMVQFAALAGQSPEGLPAQFKDRWGADFDAPGPELAAALQRIAWDAVRGAPALPPGDALELSGGAVQAGPTEASEIAEVPQAALIAPARAGDGRRAVGLAPLRDWGTGLPFLDQMKTARPFFGHLAGQFGGMDHADLVAGGYLDAQGWPRKMPVQAGSLGTMILTDLPEGAVLAKGRYVLRFKGRGVIEVAGRAENVRYGKNQVAFDFSPGPGGVDIRVQRITAGDPPREITVVREDRMAAHDKGALFNPDYLALLRGFDAVRFMDWMETNNSAQSAWADRPQRSDATWAEGAPLEVMLALANELGVDAWFNMPHLADDDYMTQFAQSVYAGLAPERRAYVEFSNEVWNWQFAQAAWADETAKARWGESDVWMQAYAARAADMARIWGAVYADAPGRLVRVISSQTGWLGLEEQVFDAPLWRAENAQNTRVSDLFEAYAITGYFGGIIGTQERAPQVHEWLAQSAAKAAQEAEAAGLSGAGAAEYVAAHRYDQAVELAASELRSGAVSGARVDTLHDLAGRVWPYHYSVAQRQGLVNLVMYEGGSHVVGLGPMVEDAALAEFFQQLNYSPQMGALYGDLRQAWRDAGGDMFNGYADVMAPSKWGSWGARRYLSDDNSRWQALKAE